MATKLSMLHRRLERWLYWPFVPPIVLGWLLAGALGLVAPLPVAGCAGFCASVAAFLARVWRDERRDRAAARQRRLAKAQSEKREPAENYVPEDEWY